MTSQQFANAESIARRMAAATSGLDAAHWQLAAILIHLQQTSQNCKTEKLPHNEGAENKTIIIVR